MGSGSNLLCLGDGRPGPGQELVETIIRPEIDKPGQDVGKPGLRFDIVELAGFGLLPTS
jgi:hypothetical protein